MHCSQWKCRVCFRCAQGNAIESAIEGVRENIESYYQIHTKVSLDGRHCVQPVVAGVGHIHVILGRTTKREIECRGQQQQLELLYILYKGFQITLVQQIRIHAGHIHGLGHAHSTGLTAANVRFEELSHHTHYMRLTLPEPIIGGRRIWTWMLVRPATAGEFVKVLAGISLYVHCVDEARRCADALLATADGVGFSYYKEELN